MTPIVNHQYQYILLYSAKSGCSSLRSLYLDVHADELSDEQKSRLDFYHNVNEIHPYDPSDDYSSYFTYTITRNPYSRIVSAYLDQYVFARHAGVKNMMQAHPPKEREPNNFLDFLKYLKTVPDQQRDSHFQSQSHFAYAEMVVTQASWLYRWIGKKPEHAFGVKYSGDIADFNEHSKKVFKRVFKNNKTKLESALKALDNMKRRNSSFYGEPDYANAATMSLAELDDIVFPPKPQYFYTNQEVIDLVNDIYAKDFDLFGYSRNVIPHKVTSTNMDVLPQGFDWRMYLRLNPDLPKQDIYNERSVVRHFLEFGRFENHPRAYKIEAPQGFDWRRYLSLHNDLVRAGINTELAAIEHYISFGIREEREI